jgi:O-antigen ligase
MKKIKSFIFEKKNTLNKLTFIFVAFLPFSLFLGSAIINSFVILCSIFFILEISKKNDYFNEKKNIFLLSFFVLYLIFNSIFISKVPVESLERSLGVIRFLILIMAVSHIIILKKSKYEQLLYKIWFIIFIITTADLIFEYFFGHNILGYKSYMPGRLSGFLNQELKIGNYYYGFILFAISYSIYNFKNKISFALFGIFFFTSIIIGERANFIRIFIMMIIFLFFIEKKLFRKIIYISLFFIILIFTFKDTKVKSRIFDQTIGILGNTKYDLTKSILNTQYGAHYYAAIKIFEENKMFGVGIKNFRYVSGDPKFQNTNNESVWSKHSWAPHPHQYHLEFLSETGIVGYAIFILTFFYLIFKSFINFKKNNNLYQLSAILFIITSLIPIIPTGSFFSPYGATIFWINCAIMLAYNKSK